MKSFAITFDEKTFARDLTGHLEKLLLEGWRGFEFAPDEELYPPNTYKQLISALPPMGAHVSFHVPNFITGKNYNPGSFSTSLQLVRNFTSFFELCGELSEYHSGITQIQPAPVVLHGAEHQHAGEHLHMREQTLKFLDWGVNYCAKRSLPLLICLENAYSPNHMTVAEEFHELKELLQCLKGYPLGFCADLPHLAGASNTTLSQLSHLASSQGESLEPWLKEHLKHIHLHGYQQSPYRSHLPLHSAPATQSPAVLNDDFQFLESLGYQGLWVNEVLGLSENEAFTSISKDLAYLKNLSL